ILQHDLLCLLDRYGHIWRDTEKAISRVCDRVGNEAVDDALEIQMVEDLKLGFRRIPILIQPHRLRRCRARREGQERRNDAESVAGRHHVAGAPNSMHVVVAWAHSRPSPSRRRASAVAILPPMWTTVPMARRVPLSSLIART